MDLFFLVKLYRLNAIRSVNHYLCPILVICAHEAEARICNHKVNVSLKFDECGRAAFSIRLRISSFCEKNKVFKLKVEVFLFLKNLM